MNHPSVIVLHLQKAGDILCTSAIPLSDKRLLHPGVEEFLIEEAEGLSVKKDITLLIHIVEKDPAAEEGIATAIHRHFSFSSQKQKMKMQKILKLGGESLLISVVFLAFMVFIALAITTFFPENTLMITFRELFIIFGWVALWRPADLLLYEWRIYRRRAKLLGRLAHCHVNFIK